MNSADTHEDAQDGGAVVPELERRRRRGPAALLILIALAALLVGALDVFSRSVVYYKTPSEILLAAHDSNARLSGTVAQGSIVNDAARGTVTFVVTDGTTSLKVVYPGPAPDTLKDDALAVAEGSLGPDRVFHATNVFARCPSKFQRKGA